MHATSVFIFLLIMSTTHAQSAPPRLTVEQAVQMALEKNESLRANHLDTDVERARFSQAKRWEDPQFEIGSDQKSETEGTTRFWRAGISQAIPRPGLLRGRADLAELRIRESEVESETAELDLRGDVLLRIYAHKVAREKAFHAKERYERFRTLESYLKSRPFSAPQKRAEALIVRSKILLLRKEMREVESLRRRAWNDLNVDLDLPTEIEIDANWRDVRPLPATNEIEQRAEARHPEMRRQVLRSQMAQATQMAASAEAWPGLALSANYANGEGARPEKNYGLGVSFSLPVWNANRGEIRAAQILTSVEELKQSRLRKYLRAEIQSSVDRFETAAANAKENPVAQLNQMEKEMRDVDAAFKRGQVDLLTFLEADSQHFESAQASLEAQLEYLKSLIEIQRLTGEAPSASGN